MSRTTLRVPALASLLAVASVLAGAEPPSRAAPAPEFTFTAHELPPRVRKLVTGVSWHRGCPVARRELRYLRIAHYDFRGRVKTGEMVVKASAVPALRRVFARLYEARFPVRRMRLVDHYGGSDYRSIEADNTSAFNCRRVTGGSRWSEHAYGRAIDIDPIENPYVSNGSTAHAASRPYLDRSRHRPGMAFRRGALVRAFAAEGWGWGGTWSDPTDYQHFSATGR